MLTESESQALIDAAEQYAETKGGWTTARHASYATTDVPVTALSSDVQRSGSVTHRCTLDECVAHSAPWLTLSTFGGAAAGGVGVSEWHLLHCIVAWCPV